MLVIRLQRTGRKNYPSYKIVVKDKTKSAKGGRSVEEVGFYNPSTKEKNIKGERIKYWMGVGAKPSPTVHNFLVREKIIEGKKIPKHKKAKKKEEEATAAVPVVKAPEAQQTPEKPKETVDEVKKEGV